MRLPATSFAGVLGAYDVLINWGDREYREDIRTLRRNAYEDLLDGLRHLEPRAADAKSETQMKTAYALAEKARVMYSAGGDINGSVAALKLSRDAFLSASLKAEDESAS
ncbi:hypothetical protein DFR24_4716 [Panacagrimonas perspica]|uniref:Uncharacterized protein n=1 Tax=Panacagrimonas perspica TaxID=381431 RepID=A0A4V3F497_9GAMM|nr:hypothetical protein [Panacagrimonas perspica]TDU24446.1 hypothetical protein DFR24_4716 [Panacagrimonas perspica]THD01423.1 hypothetical protein B1810_19975 [Panacagrimonas perspica]